MRDTKHLGKHANKLAEQAKEKALFRSQRKAVEAGAHGTLDYTIIGTNIGRLGQLGALNQAQAQAEADATREAVRQATFQPQEQLDRFTGQVAGYSGRCRYGYG